MTLCYGNHEKLSSQKFSLGQLSSITFSMRIHCDPNWLKTFLAHCSIKFHLLNGQGCVVFEDEMSLDIFRIFHPREISRRPSRIILREFKSTTGGNLRCPVDVGVSIESTLLFTGTRYVENSSPMDLPPSSADIKRDLPVTLDSTVQGESRTTFESGPLPSSAPGALTQNLKSVMTDGPDDKVNAVITTDVDGYGRDAQAHVLRTTAQCSRSTEE